MLSETMKPAYDESWHEYAKRLELPDDEATWEFFRQVVFDHFNAFNQHFPDFNLDDYEPRIEYFTAEQANDDVRFLENKVMDDWERHYDDCAAKNKPYVIYQEMSKNLTPPFPPVLIHSTHLKDKGWQVYGRPYQLVEGCHRVSYLRHMLAKLVITPDSRHKFVVLRHRGTN
jgi:hypothetical protein